MKKTSLIFSLILSSFLISIFTTKLIYAQNERVCAGALCNYECQLADIKANEQTGQNWDVTYCISAETPQQLQQITQVTATCREAPLSDENIIGIATERQNCSCHYDDKMSPTSRPDLYTVCNLVDGNPLTAPAPAVSTTKTLSHDLPILEDPQTGKYYTCFTLQQLDRNMGVIETIFQDAQGNILCRPENADVIPGNYSWFEYFDNTLEDRVGVSLPPWLYKDPTERSPKDLFCSTITGKGSDADDLGILTFVKGITEPAINTALGCVATDLEGFSRDFLALAIGIGGPIGLLFMLYGVFLITTAQGNPTKVEQGKQIISSVIQGLLILTLAVVLLNFLGINILGLPGLQ